jgi:D-alanyl-D-alanine carboxypeptidase (penicillin-binding protein 5/6)
MLVVMLVGRAAPSAGQEVPELQITSKYYIVIDAETGEIYAQRGADKQVAMASLTKVFTAIEAIELASPDTILTTNESDMPPEAATRMGFGPGETFTLQDLLYGMLLPSGNDAAHAIARNLGHQTGDSDKEAVDRFVGWINERVQNMGLTNTHLVNPDGWGVAGHYSSARDLAAFMVYALRYPRFVDAISTSTYTTSNGYELGNTNRMLNWYDGIVGGKTGYDDDAGYCLIEVARRDGSTMISVTLDGVAPDDWYDDNRVLLDYAFEQKSLRDGDADAPALEVVTFRDPDAAVIAQNATSGGSVGTLSQPAAAPGGSDQNAGQPSSDPSVADNSAAPEVSETAGTQSATDARFLITVGVAALLIILPGVVAFRRGRREERVRATSRLTRPKSQPILMRRRDPFSSPEDDPI